MCMYALGSLPEIRHTSITKTNRKGLRMVLKLVAKIEMLEPEGLPDFCDKRLVVVGDKSYLECSSLTRPPPPWSYLKWR